jgi:hypothetical protein
MGASKSKATKNERHKKELEKKLDNLKKAMRFYY